METEEEWEQKIEEWEQKIEEWEQKIEEWEQKIEEWEQKIRTAFFEYARNNELPVFNTSYYFARQIYQMNQLSLRACLKIKLNPTIGIGLIHLNRKTLALNR